MTNSATTAARSTNPWRGFVAGPWQSLVNVRNFIQLNFQAYQGGDDFLTWAGESSDAPHSPDAIHAALLISGLGNSGSIAIAKDSALQQPLDVRQIDMPQLAFARESGLLLGVSDVMNQCGSSLDIRRVALYGVDGLRNERHRAFKSLDRSTFTAELMNERMSLLRQLSALDELRELGLAQGLEIGRPARNASEAVQWMCMTCMAVTGEWSNAAFPLARLSTFLDIYIERDISEGVLTERQAQSLVGDLLERLGNMQRLCRSRSSVEYVGGQGEDGRSLVTRTSFRLLHALVQLPVAKQPVVTVLWSVAMPAAFESFCSRLSRETTMLCLENDDVLSPVHGDDYVVRHGQVAARLGQQMLMCGEAVNLPKALLYAINGGVDEESGVLVVQELDPFWGDVLQYENVVQRLDKVLDWLALVCVNAFNAEHFLRDRSAHLPDADLVTALHDCDARRVMTCIVSGLCALADSLSAIRYADVHVLRNEDGLAVDYEVNGPFPVCGQGQGLADGIAEALLDIFQQKLQSQPFIYGRANVVMVKGDTKANKLAGKKTGHTPCGRRAGKPFRDFVKPDVLDVHAADCCDAKVHADIACKRSEELAECAAELQVGY